MALLTFIFSSMNSGKTLSLLTKNFMLSQRGYKVGLLKPALDNRTATISSRIGLEKECFVLGLDQLPSHLIRDQYDYLLVDEAQFLTKEQVWDLSDLVDYRNINVICYGLKLSWKGEFFEGSKTLMELSDELIQMDSICRETNSPSLFHFKKGGGDSAVETGYEELYSTVSRKVWKFLTKTQKKDI